MDPFTAVFRKLPLPNRRSVGADVNIVPSPAVFSRRRENGTPARPAAWGEDCARRCVSEANLPKGGS